MFKENEILQKIAYLYVVTGVSTLCRLIVAIPAMSSEKIFTFSFQGVDTAFVVDIKTGTIVNCQRSLFRHVDIRRIHRVL